MQYEKVEKELGIKNIQEQSDKEFIETMKKRIEGLKNCSEPSNPDPKKKEYYEIEYQREKTKLEELLQLQENTLESDNISGNISGNISSNISDKEIIKEHCKNTLWGVEDYFYDKEYHYIKKYINEGYNLSNKQTDPWEEDWNIDDIIEYKTTIMENPKSISCKNPLTNKYYDTIEEASVDLGISRHKVKRLLVDTKYILRQKYPLEMVRK
jgi:hypothetical protein